MNESKIGLLVGYGLVTCFACQVVDERDYDRVSTELRATHRQSKESGSTKASVEVFDGKAVVKVSGLGRAEELSATFLGGPFGSPQACTPDVAATILLETVMSMPHMFDIR